MFDLGSDFASASWSPFYLFFGKCVSTSLPIRRVCLNDASVKLAQDRRGTCPFAVYPRVSFTSSCVLRGMPHAFEFDFCLDHSSTVWCKGCTVCFLICLFMLFASVDYFCDSQPSAGQVWPYESISLRRQRFCILGSSLLALIHYFRDFNYSQNTTSVLSSFFPDSVLLTCLGVGLLSTLAEPSAAH